MDETSELVLKNIRKIIRSVDLHSRKIYAEIQITGPQLVLLKELQRLNTATIGMLAEKSSLSQPTVSSLIKKLLDKELIYKETDTQDKRRTNLVLSEAGHALLNKAPSLLQDSFVKNLQALPDWQRHMILSALEKLSEMMGAEDLSADPVLAPGSQLVQPH